MDPVWTWGGTFFGFKSDDGLWTHDGRHIGRIRDELIFDRNGSYLGELKNENRLIRRKGGRPIRGYSFAPYARRAPSVRFVNYVGYVMLAGYEDFPLPEAIR